MDAVKIMLHDSKLKESFWEEDLSCFIFMRNRVCHGKNVNTPFELYCCKKPSVKHLLRFGFIAYVGIVEQVSKKMQIRPIDVLL